MKISQRSLLPAIIFMFIYFLLVGKSHRLPVWLKHTLTATPSSLETIPPQIASTPRTTPGLTESLSTGSPNPTPSEENTAWKTCRNEIYGYEINYPPDWYFWAASPDGGRASCDEDLTSVFWGPDIDSMLYP